MKYAEGIYVGYRWFDKHPETAPLFPFGYGLSYTTFALSGLQLPPQIGPDGSATVTATVRNTGKRRGAEVVQLYVADPGAPVDRPVRELKGFERVDLAPGQSRVVHFVLDRRAFSFYSTAEHRWKTHPGSFEIAVGTSSRDLKLHGTLAIMDNGNAVAALNLAGKASH